MQPNRISRIGGIVNHGNNTDGQINAQRIGQQQTEEHHNHLDMSTAESDGCVEIIKKK